MDKPLIFVNNVSKSFGKKRILEHINLVVNKQSSIALLGSNGSGKSTLLKMIAGLSTLSSGTIDYVSGIRINYIPEHFPKIDLTPNDVIDAIGLIGGLSRKKIWQRKQELFNTFEFAEMADVPIKHLSKGSIQKVAVIQALLDTPDVLLLDEPLSGQDLHAQKQFIKIASELNHQGVTLIMSCHERFLVNALAHSAYEIIDHQLHLTDFSRLKATAYDSLSFDAPTPNQTIDPNLLQWIEKTEWTDFQVKLLVKREHSDLVLRALLASDYILRSMEQLDV
jgi:ABC-type multidrug transport system ATPase subunit